MEPFKENRFPTELNNFKQGIYGEINSIQCDVFRGMGSVTNRVYQLSNLKR
jgi:hypothetical protein